MATTITLHWNENLEPNIAYYNCYYGQPSGVYTLPGSPKNMGNAIEGTVDINASGTIYFAMTVVLTDGTESAFSSEISTFIDVEIIFCAGLMDPLGAMACY
jgi:hypothetical protein